MSFVSLVATQLSITIQVAIDWRRLDGTEGGCAMPKSVSTLLLPALLDHRVHGDNVRKGETMCEPNLTPPADPAVETPQSTSLSSESPNKGPADEKQAEYLAAYRLQLRRLACPGCGEGEPVF